MSSWKDKLNFGEPTSIEHEIAPGKSVKFFPVSVKTLFKMQAFIKPLSKALVALTSDNSRDAGRMMRDIGQPFLLPNGRPFEQTMPDGSKSVLRDTETIIEAITPELAALRDGQKSKAVEELVEALMLDSNLKSLAEIVTDSMRFDKGTAPPPDEILDQLPFPVFCECVVGVIKANKGVFEPLGKLMAPTLERIQASVGQRVGDRAEGPSLKINQDGETSPTPS
jgi:hypothetical protein